MESPPLNELLVPGENKVKINKPELTENRFFIEESPPLGKGDFRLWRTDYDPSENAMFLVTDDYEIIKKQIGRVKIAHLKRWQVERLIEDGILTIHNNEKNEWEDILELGSERLTITSAPVKRVIKDIKSKINEVPPAPRKTSNTTLERIPKDSAQTSLLPVARLVPQTMADLDVELGTAQADEAVTSLERIARRTYDLVKITDIQRQVTRLMALTNHISRDLIKRLGGVMERLTTLHNTAPLNEREDLYRSIQALNILLETIKKR